MTKAKLNTQKVKQFSAARAWDRNINFTRLPVVRAAGILRRLAIELLNELLDHSCPPGEPLPEQSQLNLLAFLQKDEVKVLSKSRTWKIIRRGPLRRIPKNLREKPSRSLKKLVSKTLAGKISIKKWQIISNNRVALALGGTKGNGLPDDLWPVAASLAWNDPGFKLKIALAIGAWLSKHQILAPSEPMVPTISVKAFWFLIALTGANPPKASRWFSASMRARTRLAKVLQEEALVQTMSNEWAGFWDQWLIRLTTERWPSTFYQLDQRLCKAIMALPLLKSSVRSDLCKGKKKPPTHGLRERWFDWMDGVKRLKRPSKDFRRVLLLNLSTPNYETQIPNWFKENIKLEIRNPKPETNSKS
jgi:hypothetical protein